MPLGELPIQTELVFCPPATPLATSYLQRLALSEGYWASQDVMTALYERPREQDEDSDGRPYPSYRYDPSPRRDLRRALNDLQLICQSTLKGVHEGTDAATGAVNLASSRGPIQESLTDWPRSSGQLIDRATATWRTEPANRSLRRLANFAEAVSYLDCHLQPRTSALFEVSPGTLDRMDKANYGVGICLGRFRHCPRQRSGPSRAGAAVL